MTSYSEKFLSLGFDLGRMRYALRTAIGACIALAIAWAIGLEHPQWSAMTVWAASQPMRGHLLEKCVFRLMGTVLGTIVGVLLVLAMVINPWLLVIGLSLWVGLCTYIGNVQRGFPAYGALLAGYTAAMVSLLDSAHPDHVLLLGADRMATIALGVIVAALVGYFFTKDSATELLRTRVLTLYGDILRHIVRHHADSPDGAILQEQLAALDAELDQHAAGSPARHRNVHAMRALLINGVSMILSARNQTDNQLATIYDTDLMAIADAISADKLERASERLAAILEQHSQTLSSHSPFATLQATLRLLIEATQPAGIPISQRTKSPVVLHKDIRSARDSALRVSLCLLVFGSLWVLTGVNVLSFMLLGLAVMLSVFSNFDNPAIFMRNVIAGQLMGVVAALICHWVLWPFATAEWQMVLMIMPFIFLAPLLVGHRKTLFASLDYAMVSLLLLSPQFPLTGNFITSLGQALAVLSAPIIAIFAYRYLFPATMNRKVDHLVHIMLADLERLASDDKALDRRTTWRARFYHRALILLRQATASKRYRGKAHEINTAVLTLGQLIMRCHPILRDATLTAEQRTTAANILKHSSNILTQPQNLVDYLSQSPAELPKEDQQLLERVAASSKSIVALIRA